MSGAPRIGRWSWLLVLIALLGWWLWVARKHDVGAAIERQLAASGGATLDLAAAVPFPWDRVCVVAPYSDSKATGALLGFDWNSDAHSAIRTSDSMVLLVFARDGMVVGAADFPHRLAGREGKCYRRADASFAISGKLATRRLN